MDDELYAWGVFLGDLLSTTDKAPVADSMFSPPEYDAYEDISVWISQFLQKYPYPSIYLGMLHGLTESLKEHLKERGRARPFLELEDMIKELGSLTNKKLLDGSLLPSEIDFEGYWITILPESVGNLHSLKSLYFDFRSLFVGNRVIVPFFVGKALEIPATVGNLKNLIELTINNHKITTLPDSLCELTKLEKLCISYLQLKKLPDLIGQLKNLEYLWIIDYHLEKLPESITNLNNLKILHLIGNQINLSRSQVKWIAKLQAAGCQVVRKEFEQGWMEN